jgi:hypothetical protein
MMQTREHIELPLTTYRAIEQIAQIQGVTLADAVGNLVRQFHRAENLAALRDEYQQLANKELARSLTVEEAARIEAVARQLSDIEMESEASHIWEEQTEKMNVLLQELKGTLQAFPDKTETAA